jgi:uncharacterized repeat protein (TIGR02543 family)
MNEDTTLYAGASISGNVGTENTTTITLSYNSNGGSEIKAREFTEPTEVNFEDTNYIPTREGYTFTGWYTDNSLTTKLTGKVLISTDTTVYAGWKEEASKDSDPTFETTVQGNKALNTESNTDQEQSKVETNIQKNKENTEKVLKVNNEETDKNKVKTSDDMNILLYVSIIALVGLFLLKLKNKKVIK